MRKENVNIQNDEEAIENLTPEEWKEAEKQLKELEDYEIFAQALLSATERREIFSARATAKKIYNYFISYRNVDSEEGKKTLASGVREFVVSTKGWFCLQDVYNFLQVSTREEKKAIWIALNRLCEEEKVVRHPRKNGLYRKIEHDLIEMDFRGTMIKPLEIDWPLELGSMCITYPKNVSVIAGTKDAGKTTVALDFIKRNQDKYEIHYFSNEMGEEELKMRLLLHEDMKLGDWKFKAYERQDNYGDVVRPNAINIFDWIELTDNFYQIGRIIKDIHEKLNKGMALIILQKEHGAKLAVGAGYSLRRPRLYVTLESGWAKIISAKYWKDKTVNPAGKILNYKIINGWKLLTQGLWHDEGEDPFDKKIRRYK